MCICKHVIISIDTCEKWGFLGFEKGVSRFLHQVAPKHTAILYFSQLEQQGSGLKILTPNQMLSRLPMLLAQLKAGNDSEKRKNKIRQLLYSLYISKTLTR